MRKPGKPASTFALKLLFHAYEMAAILKGSGVKDSTIPLLVASTGVEKNPSAGDR